MAAKSSVAGFLKQAASAAAAVSSQKKRLTFVMGNQASDLDSMVAAVVYSFFLQSLSKPILPGNFSPLINIPRKHFRLRGEAAGAFSEAGIDIKSVPFIDEVDIKKCVENESLEFVLVDHNRLAVSQESYGPYIKGVIDHHKDEKQYLSSCKFRTIKAVGSCCTLITLQALEEAPSLISPEIARLLGSVILLDTGNLNPQMKKTTSDDLTALKELEKIGGLQEKDYESVYNNLLNQRRDISKLTTAELLIKDTKYGVAAGLKFAIAGVGLSLEDWVKRDSQLIGALESFYEEESLDILIAMTTFTDEKKVFRRQLLICGSKAPELWDGVKNSDLELKESDVKFSGSESFPLRAFDQGNVRASRKQVMPLVYKILSEATTESKM